jgi:hypothetical protein
MTSSITIWLSYTTKNTVSHSFMLFAQSTFSQTRSNPNNSSSSHCISTHTICKSSDCSVISSKLTPSCRWPLEHIIINPNETWLICVFDRMLWNARSFWEITTMLYTALSKIDCRRTYIIAFVKYIGQWVYNKTNPKRSNRGLSVKWKITSLATPARQKLHINRIVDKTPLSGLLNHNPDPSFVLLQKVLSPSRIAAALTKAPTESSTCEFTVYCQVNRQVGDDEIAYLKKIVSSSNRETRSRFLN